MPIPCPENVDSLYLKYGKDIFDRICAVVGILILSPLFLLIAVAIKIDTPGDVVFRQKRVGHNRTLFNLYKFRSMVVDASKIGPQVTRGGDPRITRVGRILRDYKLDELPQLVNVLTGDISLVGPRPEVEKYVDMFWEDYQKILSVKPGITDYAALTYRNEEEVLSTFSDLEQGYIQEVLPRKIVLYYQYLSKVTFFEDLRIIFLTLWRIVR
jgi:lipopolysaccharide/colanic/teichoic acid biosynthesis glycosyltransferase